jgi:glutathione S-transferase
MALPILTIGNKNYSSWSMRPWLALKWAGITFEERIIPLGPRGMGPNPDILAVSPSGTVPVLELADGTKIWDTLSICEWAHEQAPDAGLWPKDAIARARQVRNVRNAFRLRSRAPDLPDELKAGESGP